MVFHDAETALADYPDSTTQLNNIIHEVLIPMVNHLSKQQEELRKATPRQKTEAELLKERYSKAKEYRETFNLTGHTGDKRKGDKVERSPDTMRKPMTPQTNTGTGAKTSQPSIYTNRPNSPNTTPGQYICHVRKRDA